MGNKRKNGVKKRHNRPNRAEDNEGRDERNGGEQTTEMMGGEATER